MEAEERDAALVRDMLRACEDIAAFTLGKREDQFLDDRQCCLAVERCLEIVGEAVRRTSLAFRRAHPEIAWRKILGLRNILAHEYGHIDGSLIYKTAMQDVPVLAATLRAILASGVRERVARYRLPRRRKVHVKSKKPKAVRKPVLLFPAAAAMRRAALRAREVARRFGTPIYVSRNGKIVALDP